MKTGIKSEGALDVILGQSKETILHLIKFSKHIKILQCGNSIV